MTEPAKISCRVTATAPGLTLTAKIDGKEFWRGDPWGGHIITTSVSDDDGECALTFTLSGKTFEHTKVDSAGTITEDVTVSVEDVSFDDIQLGHIFYAKSMYEHDHNGSGAPIQDQFWGIMGCNGTVTLPFTTPIYLWLLENM